MHEVFELAKVSDKQVVIKVKEVDNLTIATNPYVSSDYDYITVTRGEKHVLTVIRKNGTTFDFYWGRGGYTVISEGMERLKREVIQFIEQDCSISLELTTSKIDEVKVFFNNNLKKWQITLNRNGYIFLDDVTSLEQAKNRAKDYAKISSWKEEIAQTGITVHRAVLC